MNKGIMYYRLYFLLITILSGVQGFSYAQDSLPYPVILSSRQFHPTSPQDTLSTLHMVDVYHPDRIDWMYCTNAEQLSQLQRRNIPYSLAINPQVPDSSGYTAKGRVVDINGKKLVAPWMQNWKQKNANWGCVNSPEFKKVFFAQSRRLVDLGAYGLFVDDARFNDHSVEWGGCFCKYCMDGFSKFIHAETIDSLGASFNYQTYLHERSISTVQTKDKRSKVPLWNQFRRYQTQSVVKFLKEWRNDMRTYAKRPLTFLTNNFGGRWNEIYQVFDAGIAELPEDSVNAQFIQKQIGTAKSLGKQQYFTLPSDDSQKQTKALLLTYSFGSGLVIPWDVMVNKKSKSERYFGSIDTYKPIYNLFKSDNVNGIGLRKAYRDSSTPSIASLNKKDPIQINNYPGDNNRIIKITNQNANVTHGIVINANDESSVDDIKIIFPEKYKKMVQSKKVIINYEGEMIVLSVQPK